MNRSSRHRPAVHCSTLVGALLGVALVGCSTLELPTEVPLLGIEAKPQPPSRMTDLWSYVVLRQPGETSVRGFGGRIMFYGRQSHRPVRVEGTLTVFAFDADENDPDTVVPEKKYIFTPEQFARHYSRSELGHSYSVWLPWDEVGGAPRNLSLIARFESSTGEVVFGQPSNQKLPGFGSRSTRSSDPKADGDQGQAPSTAPVEVEPPQPDEPAADRVDTVELPPQFSRRLLGTEAPGRSAPLPKEAPEPAAIPSALPPAVPKEEDAAPEVDAAAEEESTDSQRPESPVDSVLERFRAQTGPGAQRVRGPMQRPPRPATSPSPLPATPQPSD